MSGWRTIESAPKDGQSIAVIANDRTLQAAFHFGEWMEEKEWLPHELSRPSLPINPTHWQPLPAAAEGGSQ